MNIILRLLLFLFAAGTLFFILKKIRNSLVQIENVVFWVLFMLGLVIISIFPGIVIYISGLIGFESPANFVYLCIIFLLLLKVFNLSLQLSKLQYQIQQLTQIIELEKSLPDRDN
jgi:hypothetical protein